MAHKILKQFALFVLSLTFLPPMIAAGQYTAGYGLDILDITSNIKNGLNTWKPLTGQCKTNSASIDKEGNLWCVGTDNPAHIYELPDGDTNWIGHSELGSGFVAVAARGDGAVFTLQQTAACGIAGGVQFYQVFRWTGTAMAPVQKCATHISLTIDNWIVVISWDPANNAQAIYYSEDNGANWTLWSDGWKYVEMWASGIGCGINLGGGVYEISTGAPAFSMGSPSANTVGCVNLPFDGDIYFAWDSAGNVYFNDDGSTTWHLIPGAVNQIVALNEWSIKALGLTGIPYHLNILLERTTQTITGSYANWPGMNPATDPKHTVTSHISMSAHNIESGPQSQTQDYRNNFSVKSSAANYFCNPFDLEHDPECTPIDNGSETCSQGGFISQPEPDPSKPGLFKSVARYIWLVDWPVTRDAPQQLGPHKWNIWVHVPVVRNCAYPTVPACDLPHVRTTVPSTVWDLYLAAGGNSLAVAKVAAGIAPLTGPWKSTFKYLKLLGQQDPIVCIHEGDVHDPTGGPCY